MFFFRQISAGSPPSFLGLWELAEIWAEEAKCFWYIHLNKLHSSTNSKRPRNAKQRTPASHFDWTCFDVRAAWQRTPVLD